MPSFRNQIVPHSFCRCCVVVLSNCELELPKISRIVPTEFRRPAGELSSPARMRFQFGARTKSSRQIAFLRGLGCSVSLWNVHKTAVFDYAAPFPLLRLGDISTETMHIDVVQIPDKLQGWRHFVDKTKPHVVLACISKEETKATATCT